jgi:nitrite reductase/ring-hydroxylating ferredoxin subunit
MTERIDLPPYPRGWFAVGSSDELALGEVRPVRYFGEPLVLFRSEDGAARVFDAYCPHLGAHLGHGGTVQGNELVCPFHGWRFGEDGACTGMPYGKRIPPAAKVRIWEVREKHGVIMVWYSAKGDMPDWEMPDFDDSNWTPCISRSWTIKGHTQEVCENTADFGHFRFIHQTNIMRPTSEPKIDGPFFTVSMESDPEALVPELRLDHPTTAGNGFCFGPGLTAADITAKDSGLEAMQRLYVTPVDERHIELRGVVTVGKLDDREATIAYAKGLSEAVFEQWEADVPIWEHKVYRKTPALNDYESTIAVFRRWYEQFYSESRAT